MIKKRILFIRPSLGAGGADKVTLTLLQHFDRSKFDVELCLMKSSGVLVSQIPNDVPVQVIGVKSIFHTVPYFIKLYKENFDYLYATSSGISVPLLIAKVFSNGKIDTIISERTSFIRKKKGSIKHRLLFILKKRLSVYANTVTVVSDSIKKELLEHTNIKEKNIQRVYNPVVPSNLNDLANEKADYDFNDEKYQTIVAIGRLEPVKNFDLILDSLPLITSSNYRLIILGDGSLFDHFTERIKSENLSDKVILKGYTANIYPYLQGADVFVLSSDFEGMPGALIQAMAMGKCCIATNCPTGPAELIQDGKNGFLVNVKDTVSLAARLDETLNNKLLRKQLGSKASENVSQYETIAAVSSYFDFLV